MTKVLKPENPNQVSEIIEWSLGDELPLDIAGTNTKRNLGRPILGKYGDADNRVIGHTLELSQLNGILLYEPEELVLTAEAGTPISDIEAAIAVNRQQLAFEPMNLERLYGTEGGTLGGVISCNLSGPRRFKSGAARDHILGIKGVSGRGELFKSGGRVVKNVTGYDLSKLMTGSYGTLAALTEITIKVLPSPEDTRTLILIGLDDELAQQAMTAAINSSHEVSGAVHLPLTLAIQSSVANISSSQTAITGLRLEGFGPSVDARIEALRINLKKYGDLEELDREDSVVFWSEVRDVRPFQKENRVLWRMSVTPSLSPLIVKNIRSEYEGEAFYDWGGGLIWYSMNQSSEDCGAQKVRSTIQNNGGGYATLIRADDISRSQVEVFQPQPKALAALSSRVKKSFDPKRIMNPDRMYLGV
ncbi:MAG: 2-hydroxy-acid oxidase [Rhodospirillales bacterium]|nr:2-hydroxy-acid oxidase [Rhodospirillales bacterium]